MSNFDVVCLSHLRWDFVYQRPQHLMSRFGRDHRVFYVEEPVFDDGPPRLDVRRNDVAWIVVPHLPHSEPGFPEFDPDDAQRELLHSLFAEYQVRDPILWYYSPMAIGFTSDLPRLVTVYDCMDELSAFLGAPAALRGREAELFSRADLVFTGGVSLYESKRNRHPHVYAFPSSVDANHFAQARHPLAEPSDQQAIPHPRLGFFGVVDERMDLDLLREVAERRPDWHFIVVGPVVKIDPATLPRFANIHYLGMKSYRELPSYLAGWDVAIMPFALNPATQFISPTKTLEYLAAGKPVVSTPIHDVVHPYGDQGLVETAGGSNGFISAVEKALLTDLDLHRQRVDALLAQVSWDQTWLRMAKLIDDVAAARLSAVPVVSP